MSPGPPVTQNGSLGTRGQFAFTMRADSISQEVYQVLEHFAMHYGQILYITKFLRGEDLGFYRELDKTGRLG
jgi:hypothetical protein